MTVIPAAHSPPWAIIASSGAATANTATSTATPQERDHGNATAAMQ